MPKSHPQIPGFVLRAIVAILHLHSQLGKHLSRSLLRGATRLAGAAKAMETFLPSLEKGIGPNVNRFNTKKLSYVELSSECLRLKQPSKPRFELCCALKGSTPDACRSARCFVQELAASGVVGTACQWLLLSTLFKGVTLVDLVCEFCGQS